MTRYSIQRSVARVLKLHGSLRAARCSTAVVPLIATLFMAATTACTGAQSLLAPDPGTVNSMLTFKLESSCASRCSFVTVGVDGAPAGRVTPQQSLQLTIPNGVHTWSATGCNGGSWSGSVELKFENQLSIQTLTCGS
jgi:hypothetical protein